MPAFSPGARARKRRPAGCGDAAGPPGRCASRGGQVPGDEVPATGPGDQPVGLDLAARLGAVAADVVEAQQHLVAARAGHRHEDVRVDDGGSRQVDDALPQPLDPRPQPGGQHLLELAERPSGRLADTVDVAARGCRQRDGRGHCLVAEELQGRQPSAVAEPVAAAGAPDGVHRVVEARAAVDVTAQRAVADAEPFGRRRRSLPSRPAAGEYRACAGRVDHVPHLLPRSGHRVSGTAPSVADVRFTRKDICHAPTCSTTPPPVIGTTLDELTRTQRMPAAKPVRGAPPTAGGGGADHDGGDRRPALTAVVVVVAR